MYIPTLYDIRKFNVTHQFQARENLSGFQKENKHTLVSSDTNENHSIRFSIQEEPIEQISAPLSKNRVFCIFWQKIIDTFSPRDDCIVQWS